MKIRKPKEERKVKDTAAYGEGYVDANKGVNGTGKNKDYDEGWIAGYQNLHGIAWERRYNVWKKER